MGWNWNDRIEGRKNVATTARVRWWAELCLLWSGGISSGRESRERERRRETGEREEQKRANGTRGLTSSSVSRNARATGVLIPGSERVGGDGKQANEAG